MNTVELMCRDPIAHYAWVMGPGNVQSLIADFAVLRSSDGSFLAATVRDVRGDIVFSHVWDEKEKVWIEL